MPRMKIGDIFTAMSDEYLILEISPTHYKILNKKLKNVFREKIKNIDDGVETNCYKVINTKWVNLVTRMKNA